jgi:hypothetical protein
MNHKTDSKKAAPSRSGPGLALYVQRTDSIDDAPRDPRMAISIMLL